MYFQRLAVIGIGLIGGSFALAAKRHGLVGHVIGVARRELTLLHALERGAADTVTNDPAEAVRDADLVYISVPLSATASIMERIAPCLRPDALVTDAASTKTSVLDVADRYLGRTCVFIGGHPMSGSEQNGPEAARADLFEGKFYFLCPTTNTPERDLQRLQKLLGDIGARVVTVDPQTHDALVAATSHLPHLVAAALAGSLADIQAPPAAPHDAFVGSGLRDTTRVAMGPTDVWRDVLMDNRDHVRAALEAFHQETARYLAAMDAGDAAALEALLVKAQRLRKGLTEE